MNTPKTKNKNIVVQEMGHEILIYDLKENKAFCLNETSAIIYGLCDGKRSVAEISQAFNNHLKQSVSEDLIWLALNDLKRDGLLEDNSLEINFNGLSRRQVIKKVGFASMIMLPVIASIIAPSAVMAASGGFANCAACTAVSQCVSNNCLNNVCSVGTTNSFAPNTSFTTVAGQCVLSGQLVCCSGVGQFVIENDTPGFDDCECV